MTTPIHSSAVQSPYAPPKAAVADQVPDAALLVRPAQVNRAIKCMWAGFTIGVLSALWRYTHMPAHLAQLMSSQGAAPDLSYMGLSAIGMLLAAGVYYCVGRGRNWARILYFIFTGLSLVSIPFSLFAVTAGLMSAAQVAFGACNLAIALYACYLLFTKPSKAWFQAIKER